MIKLLRITSLLFLAVIAIQAQAQNTVQGKVTSADDGEPLPGVNIVVEGTTQGAVTDVDGNYTIQVSDGETLVFSFIGFTSVKEAVSGRSIINVTLSSDVSELQEVVVVGYGTQQKRDVTGSIASIDGDQIAEAPVPNALNALQGKASGIQVTNSGRAGAAPTIRIRGVGSVNGIAPLYIVDGIFTDNIDFVNPADIESVEVLKDPSSLAVFGVQGANGAIIITTKKAKEGQTSVNLNSYAGFQTVHNRIGLTNADEFKMLYNEQLANLGNQPFDFSQYDGINTDWQDEILRTGFITNTSLSVKSATETNNVNLTVSYLDQEGVQKYDEYKRYTVRLRDELKINKNVKVGADINGYRWERNPTNIGISTSLYAAPVFAPKDENGNWNPSPSFQRAQVTNPVAYTEIFEGKSFSEGYRIVGSAWFEVNFLKNFNWKSTLYGDWGFNEDRSYNPLFEIGTGDSRAQFNDITSVSQSMAKYTTYQMDHILTYNKVFNDVHDVTVLGGIISRELYNVNVGATRNSESPVDIPDIPELWYVNIGQQNTNQSASGGGEEQAFLSFLSRINYSYNNKYLLNLTYRRDGSSKFGPNNKWGNFGSVGAGWIISEENFMSGVNFVNFLKLKASWGALGNDKIPNYLYYPTLNTSEAAVFGEEVIFSASPNYRRNPDLKWETVVGYDIGFEAALINDKLSADFSYYNRESTDLLVQIELPAELTVGSPFYWVNLGSVVNKGVELSLSWSDEISSDFKYTIGGNITTNSNEVTSIGDDLEFSIVQENSRTVVGQPVGSFYGLVMEGIFQTEEEIANSPQAGMAKPGDIRYKDVDGDGVFDQTADRTFIGNPNPDVYYGMSLGLSYKNFDFSIEAQGVGGNSIYRERSRSNFAVLNYEEERLGRWTGPGTSNTEPIMDNSRTNNYLHSTYFLDPGDYFRIRNVSLAYNFSSTLINRIGINTAKIYVNAQNPVTWHKARNYSPEIGGGSALRAGVDNGVYPMPSTYTLGINLNF
ncbi:SusC/RagA family TonB-linked outer membrane protein [Fulvivirga ligni]|uniref:SusC/RagA family TonB-linked outer membrane protein n=1 Tax=Fulvivirga ligni TaxID=2904246 RepID=UPI001F2F0F7F|nr:TonB-dependent receptor [Fulvivirga ligni]UII21991.1 TonB-dependent receptor [Fulvivirga ligni]